MTHLDDIQGNLLRAYDLPFARYVFLRITDAARARAWLNEVIGSVTSVTKWDKKPKWTFNVAFTFEGLQALKLPEETLASFPVAFREGMARRAVALGDTGPSDPDNWEFGKDSKELHVLVEIHAQSEAECTESYHWHQKIWHSAASIVHEKETAMLRDGTEHFGFHDGNGQPEVERSGARAYPGQGKPNAAGGWSPLALGEFVLGYRDETGSCELMPNPNVLCHNGSYMVVRMLQQNVKVFLDFLRGDSRSADDQELLAAKMVGRWRSGAPLARTPDRDDKALGNDPNRNNDFRYKDDLTGLICPRTSHIRRVNPRDAFDNDPNVTVSRHRILRRSMPYGRKFTDGDTDDGKRGIMFAAVNASIERQFEFVQKNWINDGEFIDRGQEKDPVLGNHEPDAVFTIPAKPIPKCVKGLSSFVVTAGGGYFFLPGINALQWLCDQGMHLAKGAARSNNGAENTAQGTSAASGCPFLIEFDSLAKHKKDADLLTARRQFLKQKILHDDPADFFAELRAQRPVLLTGVPEPSAVVASSADVMKVLSLSTTFPVKPYQNPINTFPPPKGLEHFLLADLNLERHDREKEAFKSAMKSGHECRAEIRKHAESLVEEAKQRRDGEIDVVEDVAKWLLIKVFATYFGVPTGGGMPKDDMNLLMPKDDMYLHISRIFWALFMNTDKNRTVQLEAVASVELLQKYLDWLVLARKAKVLELPKPPPDVLGKFIWYYVHLESPYRDVFSSQERVVANICGILIGGGGFVHAIAFIVEVLTKQHIDAWPGAVSAANGNRVDELWGYAREALRFKPQGPGIVRGTGASGATLGEVFIPPNGVVFASHQSAMMDEKLVPDPTRFDHTRPDSCYLHFGYGRNRCLAEDLVPVIITEGLRAILRLKNVHRPAGGKLKMGKPYPKSLVLSYDK